MPVLRNEGIAFYGVLVISTTYHDPVQDADVAQIVQEGFWQFVVAISANSAVLEQPGHDALHADLMRSAELGDHSA